MSKRRIQRALSGNLKSGPADENPKSQMGGACHSHHYRIRDLWGCGRGAAAGENLSDRITYLVLAFPLTRPATRHSGKVCASLVTWKGKTLSLSIDLRRGNSIACLTLAAELVRLKVDIIVSAGPIATRAAKEATTTIPIVMTNDSDPVGNGFVASLAQPGGNITGLSNLAPEISGKRLELLKEIVPKLSRVAVFGTSTRPGQRTIVKRGGTRRRGVQSEASIPRRPESQGY